MADLATLVDTTPPPARALESVIARYWSVFEADDRDLPALVASCFTPDARFESAALDRPVVGHRALVEHARTIRCALADVSVRHTTDVQWSHRSARWCWALTGRTGSVRGMDVVRFADGDDRIDLLVVFAGLLPAPA